MEQEIPDDFIRFVDERFKNFVFTILDNKEFVKNFNRLSGCNIGKSLSRKPIEIKIDEATGHPPENNGDIKKFVAFCRDLFMRFPENIIVEMVENAK